MSNTEFKKAFDDVTPDIYMQTRVLANIKEKRKKHFPIKGVLSGVLALALVAGCFGGIQYKNQNTYVDRPFSVMIVDASDDFKITEELGEETLSFPSLHIEAVYDDEDHFNVRTDEGAGICVVADDIDYVQYSAKNGSFIYYDTQKMLYDIEQENFYHVIIPVADEDAEEINNFINSSLMNPEESALKRYMKNHDTSEYFGNYDMDDYYWVYFGRYCDYITSGSDAQNYAFFLHNTKNDDCDYYNQIELNEVTVKMYPLSDKSLEGFTEEEIPSLSSVGYLPDGAVDAWYENPQMRLSELPEDEITIIVNYKDGKRAKKVVSVSFSDEGYAQFAFK